MNEDTVRNTSRPYYDPNTFNIGYPAIFDPERGVIDTNGHTISSKLNIVKSTSKSDMLDLTQNDNASTWLWRWLKGINPMRNDNSSMSVIDGRSIGNDDTGYFVNGKNLMDLEWSDFGDIRNWNKIFMMILKSFINNYILHFIQQPFEVSKFLLQVGDFNDSLTDIKYLLKKEKKRKHSIDGKPILLQDEEGHELSFDDNASFDDIVDNNNDNIELRDDIEDNIDFFPIKESNVDSSDVINNWDDLNTSTTISDNKISHKDIIRITPKSLGIFEIINSIMDKEGLRGVWRATNTSLLYNFLTMTLNAWLTGFFSPFFGISDYYLLDSLISTNVQNTLIVGLLSNIFTGLILMPIDLIKTQLLITNIENTQRSLRILSKNWSWRQEYKRIKSELWILTILNSITSRNNTSTTLFSNKFNNSLFDKRTFNLIFFNGFGMDRSLKLRWGNLLSCIYELIGICINLPIETMLHSCQIEYLIENGKCEKEELIINPIGYKPIWCSGGNTQLWRGWKISAISVLCQQGVTIMNRHGNEYESEMEF